MSGNKVGQKRVMQRAEEVDVFTFESACVRVCCVSVLYVADDGNANACLYESQTAFDL